ncbi:hypothetical protein L218DRAFT_946785 [Marasmius fiardii PR-910]|nr:hypothetical protein L218DRAFT_946785 [Marasmius fiardii PR-910]
MTSSHGFSTSKAGKGDSSIHDDPNQSQIARIVGGIIGGIALVSLMLASIIYQRIDYRRKLNQLSDQEHLSPTPFISAIADTIIRRRSKKSHLAAFGRPGNPTRRGETTFNQLSPPIYERSNPPSYSDVVLVNEPGLAGRLGGLENVIYPP